MAEAEEEHVLAIVAQAVIVAAGEGVADAVGLEGDGGAALDLAEPVSAAAVVVRAARGRAAGGLVAVDSAPGRGTTVKVRVP